MSLQPAVLGAICGVASFLVPQLVLLGQPWDHSRWFLNSPREMGLVLAAVGLGSAVAAVVGSRSTQWPFANQLLGSCMAWAGACTAMTAMLFLLGPGTIFPIVLAVGGFLLAGASGVGLLAGASARALFRLLGLPRGRV